ncbi:MAG: polysaccharide pyruvyl transferase CsaB [Ruminococcaceae bacterium]|nr:polysaccharide pyruvyl transferase CsaB [Oscillospiraceae bacterium]
MKLIALSGGAGADTARSVCAANGIVPAERVLHAFEKKDAKALAQELIAEQPTSILCFGETGFSAGLFVLPWLRKAKIPLFAIADAQTELPRSAAKFDAILCADHTVRVHLLRTAGSAVRFRLLSDGPAVLTAPHPEKRSEIVISGSYGLSNLGDEAMLTAILAQIETIDPRRTVTVLSRNPAETRTTHGIRTLPTFALGRLWCRLRRTKLFLSGGGTLLTDLTSTGSLLYYLTTIRLAHLAGAKVLLYSCGIGPFSSAANKKRTARTLNRCADAIVVRDGRSADELAAIGVTVPPIIQGSDVAFSLTPEMLGSAELPQELAALGRYVVFALRPWNADAQTAEVIAETAQRLWLEHGLASVFLGMERPKDLPLARTIAAKLTTPHLVLENITSFAAVYAVTTHAAAVVSMRLHAMIAAGLAGVPVVGISYDIKISGHLAHIGSLDCVEYADLTSDALFAQISHTLESGHAYFPPQTSDGEAVLRAMLTD